MTKVIAVNTIREVDVMSSGQYGVVCLLGQCRIDEGCNRRGSREEVQKGKNSIHTA